MSMCIDLFATHIYVVICSPYMCRDFSLHTCKYLFAMCIDLFVMCIDFFAMCIDLFATHIYVVICWLRTCKDLCGTCIDLFAAYICGLHICDRVYVVRLSSD